MWDRIEAKRAQNRYFRELDKAVIEASGRPIPKPKRRRKPPAPPPAKPVKYLDRQEVCRGVCGRPLRAANMKAGDIPGSVRVVKDGMCQLCARGARPRAIKELPPCVECATPLRSSQIALSQAPGTRIHQGHGLCTACVRRRNPDGTVRPPTDQRSPHDGTTQCVACKRTLRPTRATIAENPGTVAPAQRVEDGWICVGCKGAGGIARIATRAPASCIGCERPFCAYSEKPSGGQVVHAGRGLCGKCRKADLRAKALR